MTDTPAPEVPAGFREWRGVSPAEDHMGPFYYRRDDAGLSLGFRVAPHNCNGLGTLHGGVMMSFADYAVTMVALQGVDEHCATVSFHADFVAAAQQGDWVQASVTLSRRSRTLAFLQGELWAGDRLLLNFQSVVRRLPRAQDSAP